MDRQDALWLIRHALSQQRKDGQTKRLCWQQIGELIARLDQLQFPGHDLEGILLEVRERHPELFFPGSDRT